MKKLHSMKAVVPAPRAAEMERSEYHAIIMRSQKSLKAKIPPDTMRGKAMRNTSARLPVRTGAGGADSVVDMGFLFRTMVKSAIIQA